MEILERISLYKENYRAELELKDKLYTRLAAAGVIISACLSAQSSTFSSYKHLGTCLSVQWCIYLAISIFCVLACLLYLYRFINVRTDQLVASSTDMENYYSALVTYYEQNNPIYNLGSDYVKNEMDSYLASTFAYASTENYQNNVYRHTCLNRIFLLTIVLVITTLLNFTMSIYISNFKEEKNGSTTETASSNSTRNNSR